MQCVNCKEELKGAGRFCVKCGTPVDGENNTAIGDPLSDPAFMVKVAGSFFEEAHDSLKHIDGIKQGEEVIADLRRALDLIVKAHNRKPDAADYAELYSICFKLMGDVQMIQSGAEQVEKAGVMNRAQGVELFFHVVTAGSAGIGYINSAIANYRKALEYKNESAIRMALAAALQGVKQFKQAIEEYKKIVIAEKDSPLGIAAAMELVRLGNV
jgi:tetratricopeptide (TPR) repeat protein